MIKRSEQTLQGKPIVFVVDDDKSVLKTLSRAIEQYDHEVKAFASAKEFLANFNNEHGCLVLDLSMPDMDGLELQSELTKLRHEIPLVFITGHGEVAESVKAFRAGAIDFLEKPFRMKQLIDSIEEAITLDAKNRMHLTKKNELRERIGKLTERERDIFDLLVQADETPSSKVIARELDISHRTVEHHRSRILEKIEVKTVVELRLTVAELRLSNNS